MCKIKYVNLGFKIIKNYITVTVSGICGVPLPPTSWTCSAATAPFGCASPVV